MDSTRGLAMSATVNSKSKLWTARLMMPVTREATVAWRRTASVLDAPCESDPVQQGNAKLTIEGILKWISEDTHLSVTDSISAGDNAIGMTPRMQTRTTELRRNISVAYLSCVLISLWCRLRRFHLISAPRVDTWVYSCSQDQKTSDKMEALMSTPRFWCKTFRRVIHNIDWRGKKLRSWARYRLRWRHRCRSRCWKSCTCLASFLYRVQLVYLLREFGEYSTGI